MRVFFAGIRRLIQVCLVLGLLIGVVGFVISSDSGIALICAAAPTLSVLGFWTLLMIEGAPRALGQYCAGKLCGQSLYALSATPFHLRLKPGRKLSISWKRSYYGPVWMWRADGRFDPRARIWITVGGWLATFVAFAVAFVFSLSAPYGPMQFILPLLTVLWGIYAVENLVPIDFYAARLDGFELYRLLKDPEASREKLVLDHMAFFVDGLIPGHHWPALLVDEELPGVRSFAGKARWYRQAIVSAVFQQGAEATAALVETQLREVESWPPTLLARAAAFDYRIYAALYVTIALYCPAKARSILPSESGLSTLAKTKRDIALAAISAIEEPADQAKSRFAKARRDFARAGWRLSDRLEGKTLFSIARQGLQLKVGPDSCVFEISRLWNNGVRPRDWDTTLLEDLAKTGRKPPYWALYARASLAHKIDGGDAAAVVSQFEKIVNDPQFRQARESIRWRLWMEMAVFYALQMRDLARASEALEQARSIDPGSVHPSRAEAAVLALSGRGDQALEVLKTVEADYAARPPWLPRYEPDLEQMASIRALVEEGGVQRLP